MASKVGIDLQKVGESVIAIGEAHGAELGIALDKALHAHVPARGKGKLDWHAVVTTLLAALKADLDALIAALEAHEKELADDDAPRTARDEAAAGVYDALVLLRDSVGGVYGTAAVRALGFDGPTPQDPVALKQLGGSVLKALGTAKLPKPRLQGARVDLKDVGEKLSGPLAALATALKDVAREAREAQATTSRKNAAVAALSERLSATIPVLEGLFLIAGLHDLADRVRPSAGGGGSSPSDAAEPTAAPSTKAP